MTPTCPLGRTRTFNMSSVDGTSIQRAHYTAAALPAIGETIFVRRTEPDAHGESQMSKIEPVLSVRVTSATTPFRVCAAVACER